MLEKHKEVHQAIRNFILPNGKPERVGKINLTGLTAS